MYQFEMPTERIKRELGAQLAAKDEEIGRLKIRMRALEAFVPEGLAVGDDGVLSASISPES